MTGRSALQRFEATGMPKQLKVDMCVDLGEALKAEVDRKAFGTSADLGNGIDMRRDPDETKTSVVADEELATKLAEKRGLQKGNNAVQSRAQELFAIQDVSHDADAPQIFLC